MCKHECCEATNVQARMSATDIAQLSSNNEVLTTQFQL
jgi:hypothetical protein